MSARPGSRASSSASTGSQSGDAGPGSQLHPQNIPLIDLSSRSPSPYARSRPAAATAASEDDDDDDYFLFEREPSVVRPLVADDVGTGAFSAGGGRRLAGEGSRSSWRRVLRAGGLGSFFFGTWIGWQVYVALLVVWVGGCGFGLLLMNRFILLTGVYKFPYPIAATFIQLVIAHLCLIGFSAFTRAMAQPLSRLGLGAIVAPSVPSGTQGFRGTPKSYPFPLSLLRKIPGGQGGIAGGGIFEFDLKVARQVLPLAVVFVGKVLLSNLSFAYSQMSTYTLSRVGIVPLALIFTAFLTRASHSTGVLSSTLIATITLALACIRTDARVTWESTVSGVFSTLFVALYPILLLRTYRQLVSDLVPQGDALNLNTPHNTLFVDGTTTFPMTSTTSSDAAAVDGFASGPTSREETRAYYRILHYTSLLSLVLLAPVLLLSGEVSNIRHNCYFLDVPFFWFLTVCGGLGAWAVFTSAPLLAKAAGPLALAFVGTPRAAFQLVVLGHFRLPGYAWVAVAMCWVSAAWYVLVRRDEGRVGERRRLEGR
ncbi:hypothetical protein BDY21DRAFT_354924 [Lineolata rhizophorae]|uniref:GDP-mannose transporter n=1 Tax=Lineolata rhizophorae TaxID=578093 RepID=A0A6A6NPX9_9PEZI|nr:hypothetical protein BDY21DRAFT_354924 [Lineolata rhizophorae]